MAREHIKPYALIGIGRIETHTHTQYMFDNMLTAVWRLICIKRKSFEIFASCLIMILFYRKVWMFLKQLNKIVYLECGYDMTYNNCKSNQNSGNIPIKRSERARERD